jgi:prolyl 4-hydroxylase
MKEEYKEFIGIYDESVPVKLCNIFVENYEEAKSKRTIINLSEDNKTLIRENPPTLGKKDEVAYITPLTSTIYPIPPVNDYFSFLQGCFECYLKRYNISFESTVYNDIFKIHKVRKSEGYHGWHFERGGAESIDRMMAYMTYLEAPKEGGETEFLHQSLRIKPVVGRTLIWPAGFTHMHRGNPPLDGEKMYITGWFNFARVNFNEGTEL